MNKTIPPLSLLALSLALTTGCLGGGSSSSSSTTGPVDLLTVETRQGTLQGYRDSGALIYKGVPFAKPPVGDLRWRAPQAPESWAGTKLATEAAEVCTQVARTPQWVPTGSVDAPDGYIGSEDCLYLDIYRPDSDEQNLPVLMWIHGGGWILGGATSYDGTALATSQNVIVVVGQYRLGPMGTLSSSVLADNEDPLDGSGNYLILDQLKTLEWIHDNIAGFGGDPGKVTIGGQSAGADNVYNLMLSPLTEGRNLFSQAVSMSGGLGDFLNVPPSDDTSNLMIDWLLQEDGLADGWESAAAERQRMSNEELQQYLRSKSDFAIQRSIAAATERLTGARTIPTSFPILDGHVLPAEDGFDTVRRGAFRDVPLMLGSTLDESKALTLLTLGGPFKAQYDVPSGPHSWLGLLYGVLIPAPAPLAMNDVLPTQEDRDLYHNWTRESSWLMRARQIDEVATSFADAAPSMPIYNYIFSWDGGNDPDVADYTLIYGAAHSVDIPFLFGQMDPEKATAYSDFSFTENNQPGRALLSDAMQSYLGEFMRSGDPNKADSSLPIWPNWTPASPDVLDFNASMDQLALKHDQFRLTPEQVEANITNNYNHPLFQELLK